MSKSIIVSGTVVHIGQTETVGAKGFQKRLLVVETADDKYPQQLSLEVTGDRIPLLDSLSIGDQVDASINLKGRKWDGPNGTKWFNTLEAWKIDSKTQQRQAAPQTPAGNLPSQDDIPFASCELAHEPSPIAKVLR